ncbi:MAG: hypothetical protein KGI80_05665 [Verrucomicrobiota bacterium]|nr:hypothetical protein [Verrucomicrobiota bacterium]
MSIPIDGSLAEILRMAKGDIDRRRKLEAHLQVLIEKEEAQTRILKRALGDRDKLQREWEATSNSPRAKRHQFATLPWIAEELTKEEQVQFAQQKYSDELDRDKRLMEELDKIHNEKKETLEALKEYKLEGNHCITS